jgi:hypothetical protein
MIEQFEMAESRAFYRPKGLISAGELVDKITLALQLGRQIGIREMLVNIQGAFGFETPGPSFRRWAVQRWALAGAGGLRVAMVARGELICPQKTGLLIAAEQGLHAHICTQETEAFGWLDAVHNQPG